MIQPLRSVHRRAFFVLAGLLPAILAAGLGARRPNPVSTAGAGAAPASWEEIKAAAKWRNHAMSSKFYRNPDRPQDLYVVVAAGMNEPDLLLYWSNNNPQGDTLPREARFVDEFKVGTPLLFPSEGIHAGSLILFSPAHQAVIDTAKVENLP